MKIIFTLFISITVSTSCSQHDKNKYESTRNIIIPNEFESKLEKLDLVNLTENITRIALETNKNCIIGRISEIKLYNNSIFILDSDVSKSLYEFDLEGKFIRKYGSYGKGPGEYLSPRSFDIDKKNDQIIISDYNTRSLLFYDLKGAFIKELKYNARCNSFLYDELKEVFFFDTYLRAIGKQNKKELFSIFKGNSKGEIIDKQLPIDASLKKLLYRPKTNFCKSKKTIFYNMPFDNAIYELGEEDPIPIYTLQIQGKALKKEDFFDVNYIQLRKKIEDFNFVAFDNLSGYFILDQNLIFSIKKGKEQYKLLYNFDKEKTYLLNENLPSTDYNFSDIIWVHSNNNTIIGYYSAGGVSMSKKVAKQNSGVTDVDDLLEDHFVDNPVIIFHKLKN